MYAMNLVDVTDAKINYGILICENDDIIVNTIQRKMCEIKEQLENENIDWSIDDIVEMLPAEWHVKVQLRTKNIRI